LTRTAPPESDPKIVETYGGPEIWHSQGSVGIAGTRGIETLIVLENVRHHYHAGTTHGGGGGGHMVGATPPAGMPTVDAGRRRDRRRQIVALSSAARHVHRLAADRIRSGRGPRGTVHRRLTFFVENQLRVQGSS
jgi:hypothetical protein